MAIKLKPPVWGSISSAVPQRTAGYGPAQQNAAVSPSSPTQAVAGNPNANGQRGENTAAPPAQNQQRQYKPQPVQQAPRQSQQMPQQAPQPPRQTPAPQPQNPGPHATPRPQQRQPELPRQNNSQHGTKTTVYVHRKIWTIGGNKKFIDFTDKLSLAKVEDYGNIHGIGGKEHSRNSVIGITICDYSSGTGSGSSKTLKACLDVEDVDQLYEAAKQARLGKLKPDSSLEIKWMDMVLSMLNDWKRYPVLQDGSRAIPRGALNAMFSTVSNAKASLMPILAAPHYSYSTEKNNPYVVRNGLSPCYRLTINYSPFRKDGSPSAYPWYIGIETFDAPLNSRKNGATSHNSKEAVNKKSAFINLSCDDFWRAMVAVQRYVRTWEHHMTGPLFREAFQRLAAQQEARDSN